MTSKAGVGASRSVSRLARAHVVRAVAPLSLGLGVVWIVVAMSGALAEVRWVLGGVTVGTMVLSAWVIARPPKLLVLSSEGYAISLVRGAGVKAASWVDVASVTTRPVAGAASLVVTLNDGRTSVVPLSLLGSGQSRAQDEVRDRLNTAHGYRRFASGG